MRYSKINNSKLELLLFFQNLYTYILIFGNLIVSHPTFVYKYDFI